MFFYETKIYKTRYYIYYTTKIILCSNGHFQTKTHGKPINRRLNGFDDNWTECMPDRMRRFCMGNALVVPMITRRGVILTKIVDKE